MPDDSMPNSDPKSVPVRRASSKLAVPKVKASSEPNVTGPIKAPKASAAGQTTASPSIKSKPAKSLDSGVPDPGMGKPSPLDVPSPVDEPKVKEFKPLNPSPAVGKKVAQAGKGPPDAPGTAVRPSKGVPPSVPPISSPERRPGLPEPAVKGGGRQSAIGVTKGSKMSPVTVLGGLADMLQKEQRKTDAFPEMQPSVPDKGVDTWSAFWTPDLDAVSDTPYGASPSFR